MKLTQLVNEKEELSKIRKIDLTSGDTTQYVDQMDSAHYEFEIGDFIGFQQPNQARGRGIIDYVYRVDEDQRRIKNAYTPYFSTNKPVVYATEKAWSHGENSWNSRYHNFFRVIHAQQISPYLLAGAEVNTSRIEDQYEIYRRTGGSIRNLRFNTLLKSPNQRVQSWLTIGHNRVVASENGGIKSVSDYEQQDLLNPSDVVFRLTQAQSTSRSLDGQFQFEFHDKTSDSTASTTNFWKYHVESSFQKFNYQDASLDSAFYSQFIQDSSATNDSVRFLETRQTFSRNMEWKGHTLELGVRGRNARYRVQNEMVKDFNLSFLANLSIAGFYGKAEYLLGGLRAGDYYSRLGYVKKGDKLSARAELRSSYQRAQDFYLRYASNHQAWNVRFRPVGSNSLLLNVRLFKKVGLSGVYNRTWNSVYLNQNQLPAQEGAAIDYLRLQADWDFDWRFISVKTQVMHQQVTNKEIIRVPDLLVNQQLAFQFGMFKNKLITRIGLDAFYYSDFKGYAYAPDMKAYYLQDDLTTGNYPFVNLFAIFKIRALKIFLKYDHINYGLISGNDFYLMPRYPCTPRFTKVGINIDLFN